MSTLPTDSQERKDTPLARGCFDYFPAALAAVAQLSKAGNDKHNPGEEMHHARGKSTDHADCIARHQMERGTVDSDGFLHDVKVAWRALAQLQEALEERGAPLARGARLPDRIISDQDWAIWAATLPGQAEPDPTALLTKTPLPAGEMDLPAAVMVPSVHSISDAALKLDECDDVDGQRFCENDPSDRIAGCAARHIKDDYYGVPLQPGTWVRDKASSWFGLIQTPEAIEASSHNADMGAEYTVYLVTHEPGGNACHAFFDYDLTSDLTRVDPFKFGLELPINEGGR